MIIKAIGIHSPGGSRVREEKMSAGIHRDTVIFSNFKDKHWQRSDVG